jgi:hypothetical protein
MSESASSDQGDNSPDSPDLKPPKRLLVKSCLLAAAAVVLLLCAVGYLVVQFSKPQVDESKISETKIEKAGADDDTKPLRKNSITDILIDNPIDQAEHPLDPVILLAKAGLEHFRKNVRDYRATIVKQEEVKGKLLDKHYMECKIRQRTNDRSFAVYLKFLKPQDYTGQEAIWVEDKFGGKVIGHGGGGYRWVKIPPLEPSGTFAMRNNRYPITEIGMETLLVRMLEKAERDRNYDEIKIKIDRDITINGHSGTYIELTHPVKRDHFEFHVAKIYVDDELNIPVGYEGYNWPDQPGGEPKLMESYFYNDVKLNVGFQDSDFDPANPDYDYVYHN